ncbi:unnamed protein product [Caenorhabditis bovis]|uniref:Serine/threonine-protein phosphatase n=1 Tax=Caenorhabditis bovis TaxID=2654633 RepID=A0A8S1FAP9_9PELO|nr:unnamed protein product [Caenorhabditis bovis]
MMQKKGFGDAQIIQIIEKIIEILTPLSATIEILSPVVVFGDIHGQLADMLRFVNIVGRPPHFQFLFLGDYVDRAERSLEVIMWLFCMKILHPKKVHLLRGNHEIRRINAVYGFREEMRRKRPNAIWKFMNDAFCQLPICAIISRRILCMHGGLSENIKDIGTLRELKKPVQHKCCEESIVVDLLWADPSVESDEVKFNSARGISCTFGEKLVNQICSNLGIDMIIRGHELENNGHRFLFNNRLLTVFSAPNYSGLFSNKGSVLKISRSLKIQVVTLVPEKSVESLNLDTLHRMQAINEFDPRKPAANPSCRSHRSHTSSGFIAIDSMYAHDTKNCRIVETRRASSLTSVTPICRTPPRASTSRESLSNLEMSSKPISADDNMSLASIKRVLTKAEAEDLMSPKAPTPTPQLVKNEETKNTL